MTTPTHYVIPADEFRRIASILENSEWASDYDLLVLVEAKAIPVEGVDVWASTGMDYDFNGGMSEVEVLEVHPTVQDADYYRVVRPSDD